MEKKIDWSKAPADAEFAGTTNGFQQAVFYRNVTDDGYDYAYGGEVWDRNRGKPVCQPLIPRPSAIDWSKAPDWADRVVAGPFTGHEYWASESRRVKFNGALDTRDKTHIDSKWRVLELRPASPTWPAEGVLPPVGTVCEVVEGNRHVFLRQFDGKRVRIIAHDVDEGMPVAIFRVEDKTEENEADYHALVACRFRPIKTAEQIAAEDREKALDEMTACTSVPVLYAGQSARRTIAAQLYDAGYRKQ